MLVEDIYASEHPERAAYQDRWEILRDPSHVRTLPLSELLQLFRDAGLETDAVTTADDLTSGSGALAGDNKSDRRSERRRFGGSWKRIACRT